jgi:hypothetical protein
MAFDLLCTFPNCSNPSGLDGLDFPGICILSNAIDRSLSSKPVSENIVHGVYEHPDPYQPQLPGIERQNVTCKSLGNDD